MPLGTIHIIRIIRRNAALRDRVCLGEFDVWIMLERTEDSRLIGSGYSQNANIDLVNSVNLLRSMNVQQHLKGLLSKIGFRPYEKLSHH